MFGAGSFAEAYLALAWNRWVFFVWYLFGAALNAAWIGHGTLTLLVRKRWVKFVTALLILGSLFAGYLMLQRMPVWIPLFLPPINWSANNTGPSPRPRRNASSGCANCYR